MIRGCLYWIFGGIYTFFLVIFVLIVSPFLKQYSNFPHRVSRIWAKGLISVLCGVKVDFIGKENIDKSKNYIIVSNHRSYMDILLAGAVIPLQFRWLAKKSLFKIPMIGWVMKIAGYISVEREKLISASRSLDNVRDVLNHGKSVWIFPEGTRTREPELGRFKRGAFFLAREADIPILPVTLINTDRIFYNHMIIKEKWVKVVVGKPFNYKSLEKEAKNGKAAMRSLIDYTRDTIQKNYDRYAY